MVMLGRVVSSGRLLRYGAGERGFTARFEAKLEEMIGVKHVLTVNSGTSALIAALVGLGVGPGDEVLVPAYTWISTAVAALAVGAVPILVDIDESLTIDPEDIRRKITPYTKVIIPVHMANVVCDMAAIMEIAREHRLAVIEDSCQAVGVSYRNCRVGTIGDAGAFSFNESKNLTSGEGGAVVTNDDRIFARARMYHDVGSHTRDHALDANEPTFAGVNFRVSEFTGALLYAQLPKLDPMLRRLRRRREINVDYLSQSKKVRIARHNDPENAVGLHVTFERPQDAKTFARNRGVEYLIETNRHVYTNWEPLFSQRFFHARMNPYQWANRKIVYTAEMCSRTLHILERTCRIGLMPRYPRVAARLRAKMLLDQLR
jgi:dTDP-4-amino-4,6-dideoxygalactose transaminase